MSIECSYAYRNPENTKHWRLSWFRYETFITFFKFRFSTRRETHNFSMVTVRPSSALNSLTQPTRVRAPRSEQLDWPRPDSNPNSLRLSPNLNSLLLFKITKNPSQSFPGTTSFTSPVPFLSVVFIVTSVIVTSSPRVRVNTCINVCTYLCTRPKGSKPN